MHDDNQFTLEESLIFERYKYLNAQQKHLNSLVSTNISTTIKVTTALCSVFLVTLSFFLKETKQLDENYLTLLVEFCAVTGFVFYAMISLQTIANIAAWYGYRNDEVKVLDLADTKFKRDKPDLCNFLTWQETWFLLVTLVLTVLSYSLWLRADEYAIKIVNMSI